MKTLRAMPVLQVADVRASAAFWARLGFDCHGFWGDPAGFAIVQRGDVTLALDLSGTPALPRNQYWAAYIYVDDIEALHAEIAALGDVTLTAICDREYGCRDFDVTDPDGHVIGFGQVTAPHADGPGLGPDRGRG